MNIITARKRQGNIFTSVCQELCPRGRCLVPGGACSWMGVPALGGACSRGLVSRPSPKGEIEGDQVQPPPNPMATAAGGTHPTGMHSCLVSFCQKRRHENERN